MYKSAIRRASDLVGEMLAETNREYDHEDLVRAVLMELKDDPGAHAMNEGMDACGDCYQCPDFESVWDTAIEAILEEEAQ